mgnify:CR=1 FL=1
MKLQEKLRKAMKDKGLNQKQLAIRSNITEASMSKYLNGERNPRTDVIVKIAKGLDISVNYLLDDDPSPASPFDYASIALARCKDELSDDEKKKLIKLKD